MSAKTKRTRPDPEPSTDFTLLLAARLGLSREATEQHLAGCLERYAAQRRNVKRAAGTGLAHTRGSHCDARSNDAANAA